MASRILVVLTTALAAAVVIASCNPPAATAPSASVVPEQSVCAGISSDIGGCTADRHALTSSTCDDLATEWADVIDKAVVQSSGRRRLPPAATASQSSSAGLS